MKAQVKIKNMSWHERPRERLYAQGVAALSDTELLAIVLRIGGTDISAIELAHLLLHKFNGLSGVLGATVSELQNTKYIGPAKATAIKAVSEALLRVSTTGPAQNFYIKCPADCFLYIKRDIKFKSKEHLFTLNLDARRKVISKTLISIGTVNETLVHPREVFREAIKSNAVSIILVHNHPAGDTNPSVADIKLTKRLSRIGRRLGIKVLDHVIVCDTTYTSLKALNVF